MKRKEALNVSGPSCLRSCCSSSRRESRGIAGYFEDSQRRNRTAWAQAAGPRPARRLPNALSAICITLAAALGMSGVDAEPRGPQLVGVDIQAGRVLVAARELTDENFGESVVFVIKHDAEGTQGLILNRTMGLPAGDVLPNLGDVLTGEHEMYFGGPVEPATVRVLAAVDSDLPGAEHITDDIALINDVGVLRMHIMRKRPGRVRFFAGYVGWAPGQLAAEIGRGEWHVRRRYRDVVFDESPRRQWRLLIEEVTGRYVNYEDHVR